MNTVGRILAVGSIMATTLVGIAANSPSYWQDLMQRPNQAWVGKYGHNDKSLIAYNIRLLTEAQVSNMEEFKRLRSRLDRLEKAEDPNESVEGENNVKEENIGKEERQEERVGRK